MLSVVVPNLEMWELMEYDFCTLYFRAIFKRVTIFGNKQINTALSSSSTFCVIYQVMDCYERLTDFDSALKWQESVQQMKGKVHTALQGHFKLPSDTNALR